MLSILLATIDSFLHGCFKAASDTTFLLFISIGMLMGISSVFYFLKNEIKNV